MKVIETDIAGVVILEPDVFRDDRGYFFESWSQRRFAEAMCSAGCGWSRPEDAPPFVQDNEAWSRRGVVRGLHFQLPPHAQAKLVRVVSGRVIDVAVDVRRGSPTFGRHVAVELSGENKRQLYVPRGFAHGYSVLSDEAMFAYKCDNYYDPASERGVRFDDPALAIAWGVAPHEMVVSDRDRQLPLLSDAQVFDYDEKQY
ncbi:dTDP-4-dehydrorhamnose 3,5-epimerase [Alistipes sp. OttesenSCG-928-B03]|nr:dTDP-4-dehydrorhamnose 3,5-epimerase [Alistipes sp. OttesenSCG-928-B03]